MAGGGSLGGAGFLFIDDQEEIDALLEAMRKGRIINAITGDTAKFDKELLFRA